MDDLAISELVSSLGFEGEGAERALERLYRDCLTPSGKTEIAKIRMKAVERTLVGVFVR